MFGFNLRGYHSWNNMAASVKLTTGALYRIMFFNASASFRFYPVEGGRSYVEAQAGVGSAPEITFLNYYSLPASYSKLNSFAAFTAAWAITHNMAMQLSGTWNTLYQQNQNNDIVLYRNLFIAHVSLSVYF